MVSMILQRRELNNNVSEYLGSFAYTYIKKMDIVYFVLLF